MSGTVPLTFQLDLGAKISGVILDDNSLPMANVDLDVYTTAGEFIPSVNAGTDATGNYLLGAFPPGSYVVGADPVLGFEARLRPGFELMEYICNENNQDVQHIMGPAGQ